MALEAQERRESYLARNNEIVVQAKSHEAGLPTSIEAFFYMPGASTEDIAVVNKARKTLILKYHLSEETAPPLLVLDLTDKRTIAPFSLAEV